MLALRKKICFFSLIYLMEVAMFAVNVCDLSETGRSSFVLVAGLFLLIAGVIVMRWVHASAGRTSVVVAPLVL